VEDVAECGVWPGKRQQVRYCCERIAAPFGHRLRVEDLQAPTARRALSKPEVGVVKLFESQSLGDGDEGDVGRKQCLVQVSLSLDADRIGALIQAGEPRKMVKETSEGETLLLSKRESALPPPCGVPPSLALHQVGHTHRLQRLEHQRLHFGSPRVRLDVLGIPVYVCVRVCVCVCVCARARVARECGTGVWHGSVAWECGTGVWWWWLNYFYGRALVR
jgi:hypothetical protein